MSADAPPITKKLMNTASIQQGFTLIELLVVISILAILMAILIPFASHAVEKSRRTACLSNLRQCGIASMQYADDHDGCFPPMIASANNTDIGNALEHSNTIEKWGLLYPSYIQDLDVFWCPSRRKGTRYGRDPTPKYPAHGKTAFGVNKGEVHCTCSYFTRSGTKAKPIRIGTFSNPSSKLMGIDVFCSDGEPIGSSACHRGGYHNVVYFDGHCGVFMDKTGYLESLDVAGGNGKRVEIGWQFIEDNDGI